MNDSTLEQALTLWREAVQPVASAQRVNLLTEAELRAPPLVLLLGNHSAGKSSLINHLLGKDVQRTGVAPTDDGFTLLYHGSGETLDGEALSARPDLPFHKLRGFGPGLLRHLRGIPLDAPILHNVWLIDSPGMIDAGGDTQRPYDFGAVVKRLAEQADLVLVLFDPEKPGTTGETLQVLQQHLSGLEDRLRIVMNKMDLFTDLRDFARAYGALCWNLARALRTQDLPHIYTTSLPGRGGLSPESFQAALSELASDIAALPAKRRDSRLTRMRNDAQQVLIRARVTEALRNRIWRKKLRSIGAVALTALICGGGWALTAQVVQPDSRLGAHLVWALITGLATVGASALARKLIREAEINERAGLDPLFAEVYREPLALGDDGLRTAWAAVRQPLAKHLATMGLSAFDRVKANALRRLERVVHVELPDLHRLRAIEAPSAAPPPEAQEAAEPAQSEDARER
jgi:hypothetical protein